MLLIDVFDCTHIILNFKSFCQHQDVEVKARLNFYYSGSPEGTKSHYKYLANIIFLVYFLPLKYLELFEQRMLLPE